MKEGVMPAKELIKILNSKKEITSKPEKERKDICFTIMPFGGWLDDYYERIYCPAIEASGLEPHRADDLYRPSTIVNDIWSYTQNAKILIADLTGKNPNVFYELGMAHALAKPVNLIAESMDDIPFDLRALRIITYNKNAPDWGTILKEKIEVSIKEVIDSPLSAVLPAFLKVKADSKQTVTIGEKELLEIRQEIDLLRSEVRNKDRHIRVPIEERMSPTEAEEKIRLYLNNNMPIESIIMRLKSFGVPEEWVFRKIEELKVI